MENIIVSVDSCRHVAAWLLTVLHSSVVMAVVLSILLLATK